MKLQELPDGLRSIIGWLVACISKLDVQFPYHPDPLQIPLILLLDEPETHLHPAWQRQIIPAAQKLFPNAQIFVATHSPFVISSVNSGWIHVLRPNEKGIVTADEARPCSKGDSWIDAVEDVLGVTEWYDPETEALLTEFRALKRKTLSERGDLNSLKEKAEAIASRSESLRSMMAREMHQLQRNMAEAVAEP
jgi:predicted ATP-binding protein involved in virulence